MARGTLTPMSKVPLLRRRWKESLVSGSFGAESGASSGREVNSTSPFESRMA
jgi:hypothetical protein